MENTNLCPECSCELSFERNGSAVTYICKHCGWSVATTEFEQIDLDRTIYTISLSGNNESSSQCLSVLSKLTGKNFIECNKIIRTKGVVMSGDARTIMECRNALLEQGIKFEISPKFAY